METPDTIPELEAMRLGVDYKTILRIRKLAFPIRPLAVSEFVLIANEVGEELETLPERQRSPFLEHLLVAKKSLKYASTPEPGSKVEPRITDLILDRMTAEEVEFAYKQYVAATERVNPALEELSLEEVQELIEKVKKSPSELIGLSFLQLVNLSRHLLLSHD